MNKNKIEFSRLLELVTSGALLIMGILMPIAYIIGIIGLYGRIGKYANPLAILYNVGVDLGSFLTATVPMMILAFIVLRGRHREPEKRKLIAGTVIFHAVGTLIFNAITTVITIYSTMDSMSNSFSDEIRKFHITRLIKMVAGNIFIELLLVAAALLIIDALWRKIKWKSCVPLMIIMYAMLVVSFIARGFASGYYFVFMLLVSIYVREELPERSTPVTVGIGGAAAVAVLSLLTFIASDIVVSIILMIAGHGNMYSNNDAVNLWYTLRKVAEVIIFLISLTMPLLLMGRKFPPSEAAVAEE